MVAVKANSAQSFLKSPDARIKAFLFFGTDPGMVADRASELAHRLAARDNPPGEVLRLDDTDLESDSGRLSVELNTIPMFGGRKIVRAATGRRINANTLKPLLEHADLAGLLIVEASGNLKPDDSLRLMFERPAHAAAIACYGDEERDLASLVGEIVSAAGATIEPEAQQLLVSRLGADRTLSRGEVEKLVLYAHGKPRIEVEDVEAIVGDASEMAIDRVLLAAASGQTAAAVNEVVRAVQSGESAQGIILAAQRYFQRLHRVRVALDAGRQFEDVVRTLRPPLFFKLKPQFAAQTRAWSAPMLLEAMTEIAAAAQKARLASALEEEIVERLLWSLARRVARPGRG